MNTLSKQDIQEIAKIDNQVCISIFLNPHRTIKDKKKDRIIFKNFVDQADHYLKHKKMRSTDRNSLLKPARKLLMDPMFWTYQSMGLAVYLSKDWYGFYKLPIKVGESAQIEKRFNLKPLLKYFDTNNRFFLLCLDQQGCKLFEGSIDGLAEKHVPGFEKALEEKDLILAQKQLQLHNSKVGESNALYHGHCESEQYKTRIKEYFQRIDRELQKTLQGSCVPLILGGVDYLHAIYRDVNSYKHLAKESINGNTKDLAHDQLQKQAFETMQPTFNSVNEEALLRYQQSSQVGRTSTDANQCLDAASAGQIESLILRDLASPRRFFQDTNSQIVISEKEEDLTGVVALETLLHGGDLYFVKSDSDDKASVKAIFRD